MFVLPKKTLPENKCMMYFRLSVCHPSSTQLSKLRSSCQSSLFSQASFVLDHSILGSTGCQCLICVLDLNLHPPADPTFLLRAYCHRFSLVCAFVPSVQSVERMWFSFVLSFWGLFYFLCLPCWVGGPASLVTPAVALCPLRSMFFT